jgi:hypothetical protein
MVKAARLQMPLILGVFLIHSCGTEKHRKTHSSGAYVIPRNSLYLYLFDLDHRVLQIKSVTAKQMALQM